ncbi:MAG: DEAD/DEAH box helicase [Salinimicrobium sp.]
MSFKNLELTQPLLRAIETQGYTTPTPIQKQAIPLVLQGKDLLGVAQTGTGKTAAFGIPLLQILDQKNNSKRGIKALILTPTRELAIQIDESLEAYGKYTKLSHTVIFGGVSQVSQVSKLKRGVDILVATPGRLLDLMNQGFINLRQLEIFVLDEADRMLDMGFIHDVKKVIKVLPSKRQTLFFSATMPEEIQSLANMMLKNPAKVEVTPPSSTVDKIQQQIYFTNKPDKRKLLLHLLETNGISTALVFTRTKHGADKVARFLDKAKIKSAAIHGNKSQNSRQNALKNFKNGNLNVLVATDIAARGIDIDELKHVINFDLPNVPETYVHRIGRTGRAGNEGMAISFCAAEERKELKDIEKLAKIRIPVIEGHPFPMDLNAEEPVAAPAQGRNRNNRQRRRR